MQDKLKDLKLTEKEWLVGLGFAFVGFTGGIILKKQVKNLFGKLGLLGQNKFSGINRPTAGAQHEKELPRGKHPIQLYSMGTPNGQKVTILLEELGLKYDAWLIHIMKSEQFGSGFVDINPNSKIPALVDYTEDDKEGVRVFESGSILLHLAEKTGKFIPKDPKQRAECLNILFFQMGSAPYFGQFGHFKNYCPKGFWYDHDYALNRYQMETSRILSVLDLILKDREYLAGPEYTIADIAWYPWVSGIPRFYKANKDVGLDKLQNVQRWLKAIESRDAVQRGLKINQPWVENQPKDHHSE